MFAVPKTENELTRDWFCSVLGRQVSRADSARMGEAYGLVSTVYRCRLEGRGVPASVVVKLWTSERPVDLREVPFYGEFAPGLGIRVPRCYGGALDGQHAVLVLEDLKDARQGDCLDQLDERGATIMARTVAALHATWWERRELSSAGWLPPMTVRTREWLLTRREQCLATFGDGLPEWVRQMLDRVEAINERALELLADAPHTLLHADLHLDNVLFDGGPEHPILIDWARAARGPAAIDLVELLFSMAPRWEPALTSYVEEMRFRGVDLDLAKLHRQIGGALLRRFISATCGLSRWEPKSEREQALVEVDQQRIFGAVEKWRDGINPAPWSRSS